MSAFTADINELEARLAPLRRRAESLEAREAELQARLDALTTRLETERVRLAKAEDTLDERRIVLAQRLRDVYIKGEPPDPLLVLLESESVAQAVDTVDALSRVVDSDRRLVGTVRDYRDEVKVTRDRIARTRAEVAEAEERAAAAAAEARAATDELERKRAAVDTLLDGRRQLLANVRGDREDIEEETRGLRERSAALAAKIVQAQTSASVPAAAGAPASSATAGSAPSSSGFIFPVNGPITSGFGPRWGRMHEGIDIGVGTGTPIGAAAAGTVIIAGWQGGYGNLVVIDHGGGISTAYGHQSQIIAGVGQSVGQGQTVGLVGSTGNSTGPHLHFEVRVNGGAVDPMGYL